MARSFGLGLACFALVVAAASATQFRVGGQKGWSVPDAGFEPYNTWAGRLRFLMGNQLLFVYPKETDSVLLVEPAAYNACNVSSYVQKFDDGKTVFTLDHSGPFFFISGNEANCRANEKLIVVVLADRSGGRTPPGAPPTTSPPPSSTPSPLPSPSSSPPAAAPTLSPSSSPPAAAPALSPSSPPSGAAPPLPAPAATPTTLPPSPAASAPAPGPTSTPGSPPAPMAPPPSTTPGGGGSQPPSASANAPGAGGNSSPPPPSANDRGAAAPAVAGLVGSLGAFIGYAMLAA